MEFTDVEKKAIKKADYEYPLDDINNYLVRAENEIAEFLAVVEARLLDEDITDAQYSKDLKEFIWSLEEAHRWAQDAQTNVDGMWGYAHEVNGYA